MCLLCEKSLSRTCIIYAVFYMCVIYIIKVHIKINLTFKNVFKHIQNRTTITFQEILHLLDIKQRLQLWVSKMTGLVQFYPN